MKHVYVMLRADGAVKVGISNSPHRRAGLVQHDIGQKVQVAYVTQARSDARVLEGVAHKLLKKNHEFGEWFCVSLDEAISAISHAAEIVEGLRPDITVGVRFSPRGDTFKSEPERLSTTLESGVVRMLDEWRRNQPDLPNRAEAIRRMIMLTSHAAGGN